jgi:hypothetical protein
VPAHSAPGGACAQAQRLSRRSVVVPLGPRGSVAGRARGPKRVRGMLLALRACGANLWKLAGTPPPVAEACRTDGQARAVLSVALHPRRPASSVAGIPARHRRCLCMASSHPRHAVPIWSRPGAGLRSQARSVCMRSVAHRRKDPCCPCGLGQCLTRAPKIAGRRQGRKGRKGRKGYRIRQEEALPAVQIVPRGAPGVPLCPGFPATWCQPCAAP